MRIISHLRPISYLFNKNWYGKRVYDFENEHVKLLDIGSLVIGYAVKIIENYYDTD